MEEEEKKQEEEKPTMVESAYEAAEKLKAENDRMEQQIKRLEEIRSFQMLGGRTEVEKPQPKKEVSSLDYAEAALRGYILS